MERNSLVTISEAVTDVDACLPHAQQWERLEKQLEEVSLRRRNSGR